MSRAPDIRGGGPRALSLLLPGLTRKALGKRNYAETALLQDWDTIVGPDIASRTRPRRLIFAQTGARRDARLVLLVEPAFAVDLQHLETQLIERINAHFGFRLVARLALQQGPIPRRDVRARRAPQGLDTDDVEEPDERAKTIEDERLRDALRRLGRAVRTAGTQR